MKHYVSFEKKLEIQRWETIIKTYIVVIVLDENARQGVEDPESPVGPVSAQAVHVHLGQKGRR